MEKILKLTRCTPEYSEQITGFYERVVKHLEATVNYPRWSDTHPCRAEIEEMIGKGEQYLCMEDGKIQGAVVLNTDPEGNYAAGEWSKTLQEGEYLVVHTFAVDPAIRQKGIGSRMLDLCIAFARKEGYRAVRLDVVPGNIPAINLYKQKGFSYAGTKDLERNFEDIPEFELYELNFEE